MDHVKGVDLENLWL